MTKQIFSILIIFSISNSFSMEQNLIDYGPELIKKIDQEINNLSPKDITILEPALDKVDLGSGKIYISIFKLPIEIIKKIVFENLINFNNNDKIEIYKNYKNLALTCKFFSELARFVTLKILLFEEDFIKILNINKITTLNIVKDLLTTDQSKNYFQEIIFAGALKNTFLKSSIILKKLDREFINKIYKMGEQLREEKIQVPTPLTGFNEIQISNLHFAAYIGDVKLLRLFLEAGCNPNTRIYSLSISVHTLTPLIFLIKSINQETYEHIEIVKLLLKHKASYLNLAEDFADRRDFKEIKKLIDEELATSAPAGNNNNLQTNNYDCDLI